MTKPKQPTTSEVFGDKNKRRALAIAAKSNISVEIIELHKLAPAVWNPRTISDKDKEALKRSISEFGCIEPLVIRKADMSIVGGHQRYFVALELGLTALPCVVVELTERQAKLLNVGLNKIHGDWEIEKLSALIEELKIEDADISLTGFDEVSLAKIGIITEPEEGLTDDDAIPEAPEPISKIGDLWLLGNHRVLCGDSTKTEDVARLMDGQKADMVFTDPPYGIMYLPENRDLKKLGYLKSDTNNVEQFKEFVRATTWQIVNILREGGIYYLFMSWEFMGDIVDELRLCQCPGHNLLVWDRVKVHFRSYPQDYIPNCELFLYGWKKGKDRVKNFISGLEHTTMCHTTEKPVCLSGNAIEKSTQPKDLIVDLFLGSGSTLIACEKLNRRCYGMEIDPRYCDVIVKRWEQFTGQKAVLEGGAAPTRTLENGKEKALDKGPQAVV